MREIGATAFWGKGGKWEEVESHFPGCRHGGQILAVVRGGARIFCDSLFDLVKEGEDVGDGFSGEVGACQGGEFVVGGDEEGGWTNWRCGDFVGAGSDGGKVGEGGSGRAGSVGAGRLVKST